MPSVVASMTLLWICATSVWAQPLLFAPAPASPVQVGPGSGQMILADIDRDGHLDMVTRHLFDRSVGVFRGDGKGGFARFPGGLMRLKDQPGALALADLNGDGMLDLVVTQDHADAVDVFLGDGKGGFTPASGSPFRASGSTEPYTHGLHLVDINEDGKLDLITSNGHSHELGILLGDGRGRFAAAPSFKLNLHANQSFVAFGDIDGDGHIDLVSISGGPDSSLPSALKVWRGDGKGTFAALPGPPLHVPADPHSLMLADLRGNRRQDIVSSHGGGLLSVLENRGSGVFEPAAGSPYSINRDAFVVVAADVNRDGRTDLVAATVDSITVLLATGRSFAPATPISFPAGPGAYKLALGDLNADGAADVVASSFEGNAVTVFLGQTPRRLAAAPPLHPAARRASPVR